MKHFLVTALVGALGLTPTVAAAAPAVEKTIVREERVVEGADTDEARLVAACAARKFETTAVLDKNGTKRITKLKLCSKPGADDLAWIKTLEAAKARVGGIPDIAPDSRVKIEGELDAEIARIQKDMRR